MVEKVTAKQVEHSEADALFITNFMKDVENELNAEEEESKGVTTASAEPDEFAANMDKMKEQLIRMLA